MSFSGKVVLVTGGSSGIGAATAVLFSKEGANLAIVARNAEKLEQVAHHCAMFCTRPLIIKADVTKEASTIIKMTIEHFGKLDILVNNAAIFRRAFISDANCMQVFDDVMNTNLRSVVQLTNLAAPYLILTKGNIVNVSSIASHIVTSSGFLAYCVSKAGMDHFTRCAALDLASSGVRVNSVNPGPVRTDIISNSGLVSAGAEELMWEKMRKGTALERLSDPEEIADLIAFLASDKARGVTGSIYDSDNGYLINRQIME